MNGIMTPPTWKLSPNYLQRFYIMLTYDSIFLFAFDFKHTRLIKYKAKSVMWVGKLVKNKELER